MYGQNLNQMDEFCQIWSECHMNSQIRIRHLVWDPNGQSDRRSEISSSCCLTRMSVLCASWFMTTWSSSSESSGSWWLISYQMGFTVSVSWRSKCRTAKNISRYVVLWKINDKWALNPRLTKVMRGFTDQILLPSFVSLRMRVSPLAQIWAVSGSWRNFQPKSSSTLGARARLSWDLVLGELRRELWALINTVTEWNIALTFKTISNICEKDLNNDNPSYKVTWPESTCHSESCCYEWKWGI